MFKEKLKTPRRESAAEVCCAVDGPPSSEPGSAHGREKSISGRDYRAASNKGVSAGREAELGLHGLSRGGVRSLRAWQLSSLLGSWVTILLH